MLARFTQATVGLLDHLAGHVMAADDSPVRQQTGRRGEADTYFYLRRLTYVMVARTYRSPRRRGEIDLIGWDQDVLCFIEVKTRTSRRVKPAEAAVDLDKQRELWFVAREYLRHLAPDVPWRFDVVSVYYENPASLPGIELFKNALVVA